MLTEMASSSDRMRFKDKIIANIAKAIKGIQEAVFFRAQTTADSSPLVLRNNDRQCHKLCENLDHVFLHGLRHHSHGYWKVVTEYTHKNAVREIQNLRNVTTDLGRGRAWIFMALNDSLLESYIRCVTENTKLLKKHYAKDALLLDQQQMSVLVTLTSGLECAVFELEYDLPYLDLTAYPPRTRTASEVEEEEETASVSRRGMTASSRPSSETVASTPESTKALTDSDTASLSSLDTSALRSVRVSSVSMDSGFPGDMVSVQNNKQRSVTPIDTLSISSHGSAGEPDRLTRLENIVSRTDETDEVDGGELEVIRLKGGKKSASGIRKKKAASAKKGAKASVSQAATSAVVNELSGHIVPGSNEAGHSPTAPIKIANSSSADSLQERSVGKSPPFKNSPLGKSPQYGKSPYRRNSQVGKSPPIQEITSPGSTGSDSVGGNTSPDGNGPAFVDGGEMESSASRGLAKKLERLTAETKDSMAEQFAQLDTTVASIRATATSLHQHQEQRLQGDNSVETTTGQSISQTISPFQNAYPEHEQSNAFPHPCSTDVEVDNSNCSAIACDTPVTDTNKTVHASTEDSGNHKSALEELESKCAQLCRPLSQEDFGCGSHNVLATTSNQGVQNSDSAASNQESPLHSSDVNCVVDSVTSAGRSSEQVNEEDEEEVDFYSAPEKVGVRSNNNTTHCYNQLHDYVNYISGHHHSDEQKMGEEVVRVDKEGNVLEVEIERRDSDWNKDYALRLDNNTKLQIMLDVFTNDDEEFMKMFVSREGHSEGDLKVTFVLLTNHALYLLQQRDLDRKFESELAIPLKDLSFISLSLNKQIVNIESSGPNRKKERIWLTPGNHLLAQQMLDSLEEAMKNVQHPSTLRSHFSVGSDEPLQIIALRKYIARDSNCEEQDVEIEDYSLVFWEDTQSNKNKSASAAREGTMLLRVNDPFKGHLWKPVYVVLRDFMLCLFTDKMDSKPQQYVRLGGEQCVGCRMATTQDRAYCIEVILAKGGSWFLSVATEEEMASWRQSLCLSVSEGMQDSSNLSCLPCVSVVTGQKLLLCHEDVQTKFFRTIASAKVEEITAVAVDPEANTYCVIEFESQETGVSSERWVLYFNSPLEMDRFIQALSKVWHQVYQIPLTAGSIEDLPLQKHCQDQVFLLERATSMK